MHDVGLIVGRFQIFHDGHMRLIEHAISRSKELLIVIGSHNKSLDCRNPFSSEDRKTMLLNNIKNNVDTSKIKFAFIEDTIGSDDKWSRDLRSILYNTIDGAVMKTGCVYGHEKDSSWQQTMVANPVGYQYKEVPQTNTHLIHSTELRELFFTNHSPDLIYGIPEPTKAFLKKYKLERTEEYFNLAEEHRFIDSYKKSWAGTPFPVIHNTVDIVVRSNGNILLIKRGAFPSKGLFALPGGFINEYEKIADAAKRELFEETNIALNSFSLPPRVFDSPERSLRGRIITHAFTVDLPILINSDVKAGDDASSVHWIPEDSLKSLRSQIFSDHYEIIESFIS